MNAVATIRLVVGGFLGVFAGMNSTFFYTQGLLILPMSAEFGWSRSAASLPMLIASLTAAVAAPMVGRLIDLKGGVFVGLASLVGLACSFALMALFITGLASALTIAIFAAIVSVGSTPMSFTRVIAANFDRRRGLALGIVLAATGVGGALIPNIALPMIETSGWRSACLALAVSIAIVTPVIGILLHGTSPGEQMAFASLPQERPVRASAQLVPDRQGFLLLCLLFFLTAVATLGMIVHFVPMLRDAGVGLGGAARIAGMIGIAVVVGRLLTGFLLDHLPVEIAGGGLFLAAAAGMLLLALGGAPAALAAALLLGLAVGAEVDLITFLTARYYPIASFGLIYGRLYGVYLTGGAISPVIAGTMYDVLGNYRLYLVLAAACLVVAAIILTLIEHRSTGASQAVPGIEHALSPSKENIIVR